ncbi:MAG: hypothetical protein J1E41_00015 [Ruminococcus sp.]|nr:hypothetical protein [Ruminococcus sp.]
MNNNELQSLISNFINKNGFSSSQTADDGNKQKVENMLKNLDDKQVSKLKAVLNDPKKSQEILNSPAAKALIKKLSNNG